jgi:Domain of unknown function (DUF4350)
LDVGIAFCTMAVLAVLVLLRASLEGGRVSVPSTYDTGPAGYAALYAFLSREGVSVDRFEQPLMQLHHRNGVLVIAGDDELSTVAATREQRRDLDDWVRAGGMLDLFGTVPLRLRSVFGLPRFAPQRARSAAGGCGLRRMRRLAVSGEYTQGLAALCNDNHTALLVARGRAVAIAYRRGKGTVVYAVTPTLFDNLHLAQRDNARLAYAVLSGRTVLFEERGYGYRSGRTFWQVLPIPMRVAIWLACAGVVLAILGANLPFAPTMPANDDQQRDTGEYIASLARMLQRGRAHRAMVQRLCAAAQRVLAARSQDESARAFRERIAQLQSLSSPRAEDVLGAARLLARVREEYGW